MGAVGMSIAIKQNGTSIFSQGFGYADLENHVPATTMTSYRTASIAKTLTATAAMKLAEDGALDLDAPVQKYCPVFPKKSDPASGKEWIVTSRHLLAHRSGIRHYQGDEENITHHYTSITDGLSIFKDDPLLFQPGSQVYYSSYAYNLLGCVIEGASGRSFATYLKQSVFLPGSMNHSGIDDVLNIIPHRAQGYVRLAPATWRNSVLADTGFKSPSGGMVSTAEDLANFGAFFLEGRIVSARTVGEMFTVQSTPTSPSAYGLGWGIREANGIRQIGSNGGQQRVTTLLYLLPKYDFVFSAMINTENCLPVINMAIAAANEILQIELPKIPLPSNQDVCLEKEPS